GCAGAILWWHAAVEPRPIGRRLRCRSGRAEEHRDGRRKPNCFTHEFLSPRLSDIFAGVPSVIDQDVKSMERFDMMEPVPRNEDRVAGRELGLLFALQCLG